MNRERRGFPLEIRANGRRLTGYAALFGQKTRVGSFTEHIAAGAFQRSLAADNDVLALVDHDPARLLGRRSSGTLRLSEDAKGLAFEIDLPDTQLAHDVLALTERRDVGGMSFGFSVAKGGEAWSGDTRELRDVVLYEVSVVTAWPAYQGTTVQARAQGAGAPRLAIAKRRLQMLEPRIQTLPPRIKPLGPKK